MQPKVFIIILNWNGWEDTLECLESLRQNNYPNYQVVVVDNGSTNESVSQLEDYIDNLEKFSLLTLETNWGFSGGNNIGIKYALKNKLDYVLLLNNDTIADKNFLTELVNAGQENPKAGLLGSKIYYYNDKNKVWFAGGKLIINPFTVKGVHINLDKISKVDYITGCCLLIKKQVINKIGFLDEDYFLYYEDVDYALRAKKAGYNSFFVPKSKIWHKCSVGTQEGSPSYIYYHTRNSLMLVKKNGSVFQRILLYKLTSLIAFKQIIKLIFLPKKRKWANAVLSGLKDFYLNRTGKYENWN